MMNKKPVIETYFDISQDLDIEIETFYVDGHKMVTIKAYNLLGKKVFDTTAWYEHTYVQED